MQMQTTTTAAGRHRARRWTWDEYMRMVEAGIFTERDRVELIDGEILEMSPEGSAHAAIADNAAQLIQAAFGRGFFVRRSHPLRLGSSSGPEPDLAVVRGKPLDYFDEHPAGAALLVEVSQSSQAFDRGTKQRLYAREGVREYWVIDLVERCLWICRRPAPTGYRSVRRVTRGAVRPLRAKRSVRVAALLPRADA